MSLNSEIFHRGQRGTDAERPHIPRVRVRSLSSARHCDPAYLRRAANARRRVARSDRSPGDWQQWSTAVRLRRLAIALVTGTAGRPLAGPEPIVRTETAEDHPAIRQVNEAAFG